MLSLLLSELTNPNSLATKEKRILIKFPSPFGRRGGPFLEVPRSADKPLMTKLTRSATLASSCSGTVSISLTNCPCETCGPKFWGGKENKP